MRLLQPRVPRRDALGNLWYLAFLFLQPALGRNSLDEWLVIAASVAAFLPLYLFSLKPRRTSIGFALIAAIAGLGFLVMPWNGGGGTYLIFAAAMSSMRLAPRSALFSHGALVAGVVTEAALLGLPVWTWTVGVVGVVGVGGATVRAAEGLRYQASLLRAQEEVEQVAALAERERIARDLHDVLGHTLAVIALKAELASRLAESNPARATAEIRDVERVSRQALSEVRAAIEGCWQRGLSAEIRAAGEAMAAAGIAFDAQCPALQLSARQEAALALTLREAATNVVRHSGATQCRADLTSHPSSIVLTIADDGRGGTRQGGHGLDSMRSRMAQVGGRVEIDGGSGTTVTVTLPMTLPSDVAAVS